MEEKGKKSRIGIVNLEKRRCRRFTVDLPIEYFPIDASVPYTGRLINASEGGLLLIFFGVRFIDISQDDVDKLRDFLRNLSA